MALRNDTQVVAEAVDDAQAGDHLAWSRSARRARLAPVWILAACALILLAMAVLDRLQASRLEQAMRQTRELGLARTSLLLGFERLSAQAQSGIAPAPAVTDALVSGLQRLSDVGTAIGSGAAAQPNTIAAQCAALHTQLADAAAALLPVQERPALQAAMLTLTAEVGRVEQSGDERVQALLRRQQLEDAAGWVSTLALVLILAFSVARHHGALARAQAQVRENSQRFEGMLDTLPLMVWTCDAEARVEYINRRVGEYSGMAAKELLGHGWLALLHPDDAASVLEHWNAAVANGHTSMPPYRMRRRDGVYRWFEVRFGVSRDDQGRPLRWFGSCVDIDDVKRVQAALEEREQFYRSTLTALSEGVITFNARGRATACNPAAERMLAMPREAILKQAAGSWGMELQHDDGRPMPLADTPVALVLATARPCRDAVIAAQARTGEQRWLYINAEPVLGADGELTGVVASFRDVTERRKAQNELKMHRDHLESLVEERTRELSAVLGARTAAEQQLQALNDQLLETDRFVRLVADSVPGRLVYWDREMRCRFVNRTQSDWFGEPPEKVIGRTLREIRGDAFVEAARPRFEAALRGEEQDFERIEYSVRGVRAETRIQYIPDRREGEVKGFVVLATNITRHKQAEQLLRLRNEQLMEARDKADAANQAKSTFLANMSHEIRTPMNAIIGFAHMLRREIPDPLHQQRLSKIGNAANHLLQVINDILDLSKIEAGKLALENVDFSLDAMLSRAGSMVIESVREKGLELVINVEPVPDRLHGDPTRLMQALLNLLSNAVKFTERGAVSLRVELLEQDRGTLVLRFEVRDTGIGIAAKDLARLFTPFSQADSSSTRQHGGTGLGLAITRHIAGNMGGEAGGDSQPGKGSRFWFTARLGLGLDEAPAATPVLRGQRALVADDLAEARDAQAEMLRGLGLRVDSVASGTLALESVARADSDGDPYEIVLLDWAMPGLDGLETGTRLADAMVPPKALVLVSAREHASIHQLARDAGFGAVLMKPLTSSMLLDCLMRLLKNAARPALSTEPTSAFDGLATDGHKGARALVAEDNPVNQEVAVQLLESAGLVVDVAGDGQQAVQMARAQPYDVVFMDMQMPRMDGLEATRLLRQDPAFKTLPIIAMTANAFEEDRRACLDAGMNDHLAKPVDPRVLHAALVRWLPARRAVQHAPVAAAATTPAVPAAPAAVPAPPSPPQQTRTPDQILAPMASLVDLPRAYEYAAGQASILLRVMQQFVTHYRDAGAPLVEQIDAGDLQAPARMLHSLRGVSGMIGADRLRGMTTQLEQAITEGRDVGDLRTQAVALRTELDALVAAIAERLA